MTDRKTKLFNLQWMALFLSVLVLGLVYFTLRPSLGDAIAIFAALFLQAITAGACLVIITHLSKKWTKQTTKPF